MSRTIARLVLAGVLSTGCYASGDAAYGGGVVVSTPDLVAVSPGVHVIADYDEPIFFADGFYWWFVDGYWYRSTYYTGGWVFVATPPPLVLGIRSPLLYRHHRPAGYVVRHRPVPVHRVQRPPVRQQPVIRDHRRR